MSGLFARLAAQAAGKPRNPVQPPLQVNFRFDSEPQTSAAVEFPGQEAATEPQSAAGDLTEPRAGRPPSKTVNSADLSDPALSPGLPLSQENLSVTPTIEKTGQNPGSVEQYARQVTAAISANSLPPSETSEQNSNAVTGLTATVNRQQGVANTANSRVGDSARRDDATKVAPEPLLGTTPTSPAAFESSAFVYREAASETPNEVHVHIGRVEITAVAETRQAQRKRQNTRQPMSLDEYLGKCSGGSS